MDLFGRVSRGACNIDRRKRCKSVMDVCHVTALSSSFLALVVVLVLHTHKKKTWKNAIHFHLEDPSRRDRARAHYIAQRYI